MANGFPNRDDYDVKMEIDVKIRTGLKSKLKAIRTKPDKNAVAKAGEVHVFHTDNRSRAHNSTPSKA